MTYKENQDYYNKMMEHQMEEEGVITETFQEDMKLIILDELLDSFYTNHEGEFPEDVSEKVKELRDVLDDHIYHWKDGYGIGYSNYYSKVNFVPNPKKSKPSASFGRIKETFSKSKKEKKDDE